MQVSRRFLQCGSILVGAVCALVLTAEQGYAHDGNSNPTAIHACVQKSSNQVRIVGVTGSCTNAEVAAHWSITGPQGPQGIQGATGPQGPGGPQGPPGESSGGPPFVWVCTPGAFHNAGNSSGNIYVFNGGPSAANIAVNFLDNAGQNLAGHTVPGASPATYPGEADSTTMSLASTHTRNIHFDTPTTSGPGFDGVTDVAISIRVTSDQPITVGAVLIFSGFIPVPCNLLPK
jgi:hypothetical protein